jgi:aminobenzoyl-glutamate utilization protein B
LVDEVYKRLIKVADGAATMTETAYEIEYLGGCYELLSNKALADLLDSALQEIAPEPWSDEDRAFAEKLDGYTPETAAQWRKMFNLPSELHLFDGNISITPLGSPGSTDVGDVSHIVPTIFFMTTCSSIGASSHTWQFTACTGSSIGQKGMIHAAKIMARFGIRLLEDPEVLDKAKEEFLKETVGSTYQCPIPKELLDTHG